MFYKNELLRGAGETVQMTEEQISEWLKCKADVFYFAKYFTIIGPARGRKNEIKTISGKNYASFNR